MLSVIIPARNEEGYIGACLDALLASQGPDGVEVIVAANGCTDATVAVAESRRPTARGRGWTLEVIDQKKGGKASALNSATESRAILLASTWTPM